MTTLSPIGKFITFCSTVSKYNGQIRTAAAIQIHCRKLMIRVFLPRLCFGALLGLNQDPSGPNGLDYQNKCKAQVLLHNTLVEDHINLLLFLTTWYVDVHWPCLSTHPQTWKEEMQYVYSGRAQFPEDIDPWRNHKGKAEFGGWCFCDRRNWSWALVPREDCCYQKMKMMVLLKIKRSLIDTLRK